MVHRGGYPHEKIHLPSPTPIWYNPYEEDNYIMADTTSNRANDRCRYQVQSIQDRTREMARLVMLGISNKAIAERLSISKRQVAAIRNSSLFRQYVDELNALRDQAFIDNTEELEQLIPYAIDTYREVLEKQEGTPTLRVKVAGQVLDRTGLSAIQRSVVQKADLHLTAQDLLEIRERATAIKQRQQGAIDVSAH